jgi:zeta-toxin
MLDGWSAQELDQQKAKIKHELLSGISPAVRPHAYFLAGQPGAGKSTMAKIFTCKHQGNIAFISGDDYRKDHPRYMALQAAYGDDAVLHTQQFAGKMTEALIDDLSKSNYHLMIEGTLRTTEVPLRTRDLLVSKGYSVSLNVMLVRPEESYLGTLKRYQLMKDAGLIPRVTPKEHHDLVAHSIIDHLYTLYEQDAFPEIRVYNRAGECLYDKEKTPFRDPSDQFREEFTRDLTSKEREQIIADYAPYVTREKVEDVLRAYEDFFPKDERGRGAR